MRSAVPLPCLCDVLKSQKVEGQLPVRPSFSWSSRPLFKGSEGQLEGSEGLPEGSEGLSEGSEALPEGSEGLTEGSKGLPDWSGTFQRNLRA